MHNVGPYSVSTLKGYARQIREAASHPKALKRTIGVGQDSAGELTTGSSNGFDAGMRDKADELGIRRVPSPEDTHAEEDLIEDNRDSLWPLERVGNRYECSLRARVA